jgi:hypothetical protein
LPKPEQIPRVLQIAAQFVGQLTNLSEIGRSEETDWRELAAALLHGVISIEQGMSL